MYTIIFLMTLYYKNRNNGFLMTQQTNSQQQLFASDQNQYTWKSVQQMRRGEVIVVELHDVKILSTRQDGDYWLLSYTDPFSDKKTEQLYNANDFVYAKS
ncbi:MAG: hypothetical protein NVS2B12_21090 [Ktedonobacteraceae bacterium]